MNLKNIFATFMSCVLICTGTVVPAFAATNQNATPQNLINMSVEQRSEWMEENLKPITYQVAPSSTVHNEKTGRELKYYSSFAISESLGANNEKEFVFITDFDWYADPVTQTVEKYIVTNQRLYETVPYVKVIKNKSYRKLTNSNVKIYSDVEIVRPLSGLKMAHDINVYGDGRVGYTKVNIPY